ncbi:ribosome small subunit-dependent GTPase A [Carboxylicivirga sediminis]|uniref:Small ribosomal subunit biogenesis GTPase RsgA n=1 Tax=Carboxylicivirga sediminis TaxID=2006564 RepID=A0A941F361_9BACT|nr:ribosome small subunit-dependent GTPase A [Carboxylicivirga sediminis]MBR8535084.1 ribosome small subunit-dependent GTPase A [Carboxylicivirga sediminis]
MEQKNGLVIKSTGSRYTVLSDDGTIMICRIRGKIRLQGIKSTNPVSVGDRVVFDADESGEGVISEIKERKNYIIRKATNLSKESHIIAANVDQAVLIVTINYPMTSRVFVDRFIAASEAYGIPVTLVFNKTDRYDAKHMQILNEWRELYEGIGYKTMAVSAKKQEDLSEFQNLLKDKITVLSGHSGVGKSTLINRVEPSLNLKTAEISSIHHSGKHTTTFAEMHALSFGGYIIDTPGIRGFGLIHIEREELYHYFKELFEFAKDCRFNNCSHYSEPGCSVKKAVEEGHIALSRYESYLSILLDKNEKYR